MVLKECLFQTDFHDQQELFAEATKFLVSEGYVSPDFEGALVEREQLFPTGLPTTPEVAIPHTDGTYVKKDGILCILNKRKLKFNEMGGDDEDVVYPQLIFLLVIKSGGKHLEQLQQLVEKIQEGELTRRSLEAQDLQQFETIVQTFI